MEIEFHGAAREVTGSCHILRVNGRTILLDCGLFQGKRSESQAKNRKLPVPAGEIDAVILSHAHIDHAGRLPFLVAHGYAGSIWATEATRDLCGIMLPDSAKIQEQDAKFLGKRGREYIPPLYSTDDAALAVRRILPMPYHVPFDVVPGVRATFLDAGHILGSATVVLDCTEGSRTRRVVFSGDIGRTGLALLRDPEPPEAVHALILESTYGNRLHEPVDGAREHLARTVCETAARGGRVLIPAFAVGRTQELIYTLHVLSRAGRIPEVPIWIDSPLATNATTIFGKHPHIFDREEELIADVRNVFDFPQVRFTRDVAESKALNSATGPMIIIAASGMAESGRILHHLRYGAPDPRNTVLVVGFMAEHTLGRRIVERRDMLRILGDDIPLRAHVEIINGYSAHADQLELVTWVSRVRDSSPGLAQCFLVHGEPPAQDVLAPMLEGGGMTVSCPSPGIRAEIS